MPLIKHRPKIRLRLPPHLHPGSRFEAEAILEARRPIQVDSIDFHLDGEESSRIGSGKNQTIHRISLLRQAGQVSGRELPAGRSSFRCRFQLPEDLPPSYRGSQAATSYSITVRADIPWWPDAKEEFWLQVQQKPVALGEPEPRVYSSDPQGPKAKEPHAECSIGTTTVVPGGELMGSVALHNTAHIRYRKITLSLVNLQTRRNKRDRVLGTNEVRRYGFELPQTEVQEGAGIPFRIKIPVDVPPTFRSRLWEVGWLLELRAAVAWGRDVKLRMPIQMRPAGSRPSAKKSRYAAPSVGSERVRRIWQAVATELGLRFEDNVLTQRFDDVEVSVRRDHRGANGIFLVAELTYSHLGLHLDGGLASSFRRVFGGGITLGDAAWDRRHYLTGREGAQIRAFCQPLLGQLASQQVADIDDEHLVMETRDAGQSRKPLLTLAQAAVAVARALPEVRDAIPPPATMSAAVPAWTDLAQHLRGRLETARMAVTDGRYQGVSVAVTTEWTAEGEAQLTTISYELAMPVAESHQFGWDGEVQLGELAELPARARELVKQLQQTSVALSIQEDRLELALPAPLIDTQPIMVALEALDHLAHALRGGAGPYR